MLFSSRCASKGVTVFDLIRLAAGKEAGKEISVADACEYLSKVGLCAKDYIRREVNASLSGGDQTDRACHGHGAKDESERI